MATRTVSSSRFLINPISFSLNFAGSPQNVGAITLDFTRTAGQTFSCGCWFKGIGDGVNPGDLISIRNGSGAGQVMSVGFTSGQLINFQYDTTGSGGTVSSVNKYNDGNWHWMCLVYDGTNITGYIDNAQVAQLTSKPNAALSVNLLRFGKRADGGTEYYIGNISHMFVSTSALSSTDRSNIYYKNYYDLTKINHLWKLNEGSGTTAIDSGTSPLNGTINSCTYTTNVPSQFTVRSTAGSRFLVRNMNNSLFGDASSKYLDIGTLGTFGSNFSSGISIMFWYKTSNYGAGGLSNRIMGFFNTGTTEGLVISLSDGPLGVLNKFAINAYLRDNGGLILQGYASNVLNDSNWHHICCTWMPSTNTIQIYSDGSSKSITYANQQTPATFVNLGFPFWILTNNNRGTGNGVMNGYITKLVIANRVLTSNEITSHYYLGTNPTSCIGIYNFTEGSGGTVADTSGNGNNGTINTATWSTDVPIKSRSAT